MSVSVLQHRYRRVYTYDLVDWDARRLLGNWWHERDAFRGDQSTTYKVSEGLSERRLVVEVRMVPLMSHTRKRRGGEERFELRVVTYT